MIPGGKQKSGREGRKSPTVERQPQEHRKVSPWEHIPRHALVLSPELWALMGLVTAVGELFLEERLKERLQFTVDLFALKLHQVPLGKTRTSLPGATSSLLPPACSTTHVPCVLVIHQALSSAPGIQLGSKQSRYLIRDSLLRGNFSVRSL